MDLKCLAGVLALPLLCAAADDSAGWIPLFNGSTLDGWHVCARPADRAKEFWRVENGAITCDSRGRRDHDYVWLMSEDEYGDFELRLKVRGFRESTGNSGVQLRSRYDYAVGHLDGPQIDVHPPAPFRTGLIYDETRGVRRWIFPSLENSKIDPTKAGKGGAWKYSDEGDGWNDLAITCRGMHITSALNGTDFDGSGLLDDQTHRKYRVGRSGHIALQLHVRDDLYIQFKDIFVRPAE
jgi:hypothetical protein